MDTDRHCSSGGASSEAQSHARLSEEEGGDGNEGTCEKDQLSTEIGSIGNTAFLSASTTSPPPPFTTTTTTTDLTLPPLGELEGPSPTSFIDQQKHQHRRRQHRQWHHHQFGLPPAPALPTAAFGILPGINPFGSAYGTGGTATAQNDRRPDRYSQQTQQDQQQKQQQQQRQQGQDQQLTVFGVGSTQAIQEHQINALRGDLHTERSLPNVTTTTTTTVSRTTNENNNNYDELFIDERNSNSIGTVFERQQGSSSFNAFNQLPHTAGTFNMSDTLFDRTFLYPFDRFNTGPSAAPTPSTSVEASKFERSTLPLQQKKQIEYPGDHSDRSFGQQAMLLKMSSMATSTSDLDPIRTSSQMSQLPPSDMATVNESYHDIPSTMSNKSDLELNLELQMMILQQQQQQLVLLQRQQQQQLQQQQQQQQRQGHEVKIPVNPQPRLSDGSGSTTNSRSGHQSQQTRQQQIQQFSIRPHVALLPWAPTIPRSVLQATSGHIIDPGWANLAGASALTNYSYNLGRGASQSDDSQNLTASQHHNLSDDFTMGNSFRESNIHQFVQSTENMRTKLPLGESGVSCSSFQSHESKTADRFKLNDVRTVPRIESILDRPETQPKEDRISKSSTASTSIKKGTVLKPLSAYNYFFTDERGRLVNETEGEDQRGVRYSEERKLWLLSHHWSKDRTKRRRHRKTHGIIEFTELSRLIGQRWRHLPESEKDFYRSVAKADMERYKRDSCS